MTRLLNFIQNLILLVLTPVAAVIPFGTLLTADLVWKLLGRQRPWTLPGPQQQSASVVIPNWNGRDLLERYLPSVVTAMSGHPANEVIVVDNGSQDGSAEFVRQHFPSVRLLALPENLGFGGGSNAGFRAAANDIVVLLNSDMRVAPDFLAPLLAGFADPQVFAVSCQIFFSDPAKPRQETGLTQAAWRDGALRVRHRLDDDVQTLYPCFYGGGGSCAFDRRKFLDIGGFDSLLAPFYLEDTDLGYLAWKRGWKVLYEPQSHVWHEHRGTIGRRFTQAYIDSILQKNFLLFAWKNIHQTSWLAEHFFFTAAGAAVSVFAGNSPERASLAGLWRALRQLPAAVTSRWQARSLATVTDMEAFRRPLAGYYRDRFQTTANVPQKPSVLFLSPYPIEPPVHGGGVFMSQTLRHLVNHADVHLVVLLDRASQIADHDAMAARCRSFHHLVRMHGESHTIGSLKPHAVREFANGDLEWMLHRIIYQHGVDVLQIEYANMGQYAPAFDRIATCVFEHDVYFQSIARQLRQPGFSLRKIQATLEYLRALPYELKMLERVDDIQVCTRDNGEYLTSFRPALAPKIALNLRAGIDVDRYEFRADGRLANSILFVGSFRHLPNQEALQWFAQHVMPHVLRQNPDAKLVCVGSDPPPRHALPSLGGAIEIRGFVEDVRTAFYEHTVFICPILSGSGVRVKLLEAFACGIPVVSTTLGAEGLGRNDQEFCRLADDPQMFAQAVIELLAAPPVGMAERARAEVAQNWNMRVITQRLAQRYQQVLKRKRGV